MCLNQINIFHFQSMKGTLHSGLLFQVCYYRSVIVIPNYTLKVSNSLLVNGINPALTLCVDKIVRQ